MKIFASLMMICAMAVSIVYGSGNCTAVAGGSVSGNTTTVWNDGSATINCSGEWCYAEVTVDATVLDQPRTDDNQGMGSASVDTKVQGSGDGQGGDVWAESFAWSDSEYYDDYDETTL